MPLVQSNHYKPAGLFKNCHFNTLYPYLFRKKIDHNFERIRLNTLDGDFVDIDCLFNSNKKVAILCHGLEGSSSSQYINGITTALKDDWDIIALNYRSCSGELNLTATLYHSGFTDDLHQIIQQYSSLYEEIVLVGYSLGGNLVLKYTTDGKFEVDKKIVSVVAISVPCDLEHSGYRLMQKQNKIYIQNFLSSLKKKMLNKYHQGFEEIDIAKLEITKTLYDFDEYFTGPLHGFGNALGYYQKCSSKQYLSEINIPTLLINSLDDSFLSPECFPFEIAKDNNQFYMMATQYGGHVGFSSLRPESYWTDDTIKLFLTNRAL